MGVSWSLHTGQVMVIFWYSAFDELYLLTFSQFSLANTPYKVTFGEKSDLWKSNFYKILTWGYVFLRETGRGGGREREKERESVASQMDGIPNLGMSHDQESNQRPFGVWGDTSTRWAIWPGPKKVNFDKYFLILFQECFPFPGDIWPYKAEAKFLLLSAVRKLRQWGVSASWF